jgi:hypothetical protein
MRKKGLALCFWQFIFSEKINYLSSPLRSASASASAAQQAFAKHKVDKVALLWLILVSSNR